MNDEQVIEIIRDKGENSILSLFSLIQEELKAIERFLDKKQNVDVVCKMTDSRLFFSLRKIHILLNDLTYFKNIHFYDSDRFTIVLMLRARTLSIQYIEIIKNISISLSDCITNYTCDFDSSTDTNTPYKLEHSNLHVFLTENANTKLSDLDEIHSSAISIIDKRGGILEMLKSVDHIVKEYYKCDSWLLINFVAVRDINYVAFRNYIRERALDMSKNVRRELKHQIQTLIDDPTEGISKTAWIKMLRIESEMMKSSTKKELVSSTDNNMERYKIDEKKLIEENSDLIKKIQGIYVDDELFDLEELPNLVEDLTSDNFELFVNLLLRGNIIRCNIYPELKPQFEAWLKGEEVDKAEETKSPDTTKEKKQTNSVTRDKKSPLASKKANELWEKLQAAGYVDENLMPAEGLSMAQKGAIAWNMAFKLDIKNFWAEFGKWWNVNSETMRKAYDRGIEKPKIKIFSDKILSVLK